MPELPEVETVVRTLRPHVSGRFIAHAAELRRPCMQKESLPLAACCGARIAEVSRRGKLALVHLELSDGKRALLAVHLRMTGRLCADEDREAAVESDEALVRADAYARAVLVLADSPDGAPCARLRFCDVRTFGRMFLGEPERFGRWSYWREMGPDALAVPAPDFAARLKSRTAIKTALLDQRVVAGIGNIYADESLFAAGIHPKRPACSLSTEERVRLHGCLQEVLQRSISECGSSIRDYRDADGNVGAFQNFFAVYGRAQERCVRCAGKLAKCTIGGRTTVFCPKCQKLKG